MTPRAAIDAFLAQRTIAVAGASRNGKGFGNVAAKELRAKGYRVHLVHPEAAEVDGQPCHKSLAELPEAVGSVLVVVPPEKALGVVQDAAAAGVKHVWLQQGADSETAVLWGRAHGASVVAGECILMFVEPVRSFHRFHRTIRRLLGRMPAGEVGGEQ